MSYTLNMRANDTTTQFHKPKYVAPALDMSLVA